MGGHPRDGQPLFRAHALACVVAATPVWIGHDRLATDLMEGDVLRRVARRRCDTDRRRHPSRIVRRPLQHLHSAHGAADDGEQGLDAQGVDQHGLGADHVPDGHHGKAQAIRGAGHRVDGRRPGGSHATADHIGADDKIARWIQRQPGPHGPAPPSGLSRHRVIGGQVLVAGQGVADENRVRAIRVELAIGPVGDFQAIQPGAGVKAQRTVRAKTHQPAVRPDHFQQARLAVHGGVGPPGPRPVNRSLRSCAGAGHDHPRHDCDRAQMFRAWFTVPMEPTRLSG